MNDSGRPALCAKMMLYLSFAVALIIMPATLAAEPILPNEIEVSDGDTIEARGHLFRLIGFDTPEFSSRGRKVSLREKRLALLAAERLQEIVNAGNLDLQEVACSCTPSKIASGKCNYGRKCGVLSSGGKNVGDTLIREGHAREYICAKTRCPKQEPWE